MTHLRAQRTCPIVLSAATTINGMSCGTVTSAKIVTAMTNPSNPALAPVRSGCCRVRRDIRVTTSAEVESAIDAGGTRSAMADLKGLSDTPSDCDKTVKMNPTCTLRDQHYRHYLMNVKHGSPATMYLIRLR